MNHSAPRAGHALDDLQRLIRDAVGDSTAVVLVIAPRQASSAPAPTWPSRSAQPRPRRTPDVVDFVREWTSGATPLPVGAVASTDLFSAFLTWAERLGRRVYASDMNTFVPAAIDAGGLRKRRARFRIGVDRGQAMVLAPEGAEECGGSDLGRQLASFRRSLAAWSAREQASAHVAPQSSPRAGDRGRGVALGSSTKGEGASEQLSRQAGER
ncbi:MAG: hypothetical protein KJ023_08775 [Burkholderiaceae bacterium]|nr:hypothetical protein [Burkholderiaceae bacterium]